MPGLPRWISVKLPGDGRYHAVRQRLASLDLHTVCEEAFCPNIAECWGGGTATFMILGDVCTRGCRFCNVTSGHPDQPPDPREPDRLVQAVETMGLRYVVITSVDRDDLPDQGSGHFLRAVKAIKNKLPRVRVELLTPDFRGELDPIQRVATSGAEVLGHNIETIRSLTPSVRDVRCSYDLSLRVLETYRRLGAASLTKSSIMLGLGEQHRDVLRALRDLRSVDVDWVTLGQYLRPSSKHLAVKRFVSPEEFRELAEAAKALGFSLVNAGPLVRSSYRAAEAGAQQLIDAKRGQ